MTTLEDAAETVIEQNTKAVYEYHEGEGGALNYMVGQVLTELRGDANPPEIVDELEEQLAEYPKERAVAKMAFLEGYKQGYNVESPDDHTIKTAKSLFERWWETNNDS